MEEKLRRIMIGLLHSLRHSERMNWKFTEHYNEDTNDAIHLLRQDWKAGKHIHSQSLIKYFERENNHEEMPCMPRRCN